MSETDIVARIETAIPDAEVSIQGQDCNFAVHVKSASFATLSRVQQQQKVLALFREEIAVGVLHSLTVKAYAK